MSPELQKKLDLFAANAQTMKKEFKWRAPLTGRLAALLYAFEAKPVDCAAIRECNAIIKSNTGFFSMFRSNMSLSVAAMLSMKENPGELFAQTQTVYDMMKNAKFRASIYLAIAAYEIAANAAPENYQNIVIRAKAFYDGMKANGFFRTGTDDYIFAAMLGLSDIDVKEGTQRIDKLNKQLSRDFSPGNSVQMLAQILVLGGEPNPAIDRLYQLKDELKSKKMRFDKRFTLSSLGLFALLSVDINNLVQDIEDTHTFLRKQKGFSKFTIPKQTLLLLTAAIVASSYAKEENTGVLSTSISTNIAGIIIAQQTVMMAVMVSVGVAATSAAAR